MRINPTLTKSLLDGTAKIAPILGIEITDAPDAIKLTAVCGKRIGVTLKDGEAVIYYRDRVQFYRGLGLLVENAKLNNAFDITESCPFDTVSTMIDASRGFVPTVSSVKKLIDRLALMGYNMMMLYTEDVIELEDRPFFGYMRGRYTKEELREIDDYAYSFGIEVIPCIECYGHMERYLIWAEAANIKDTSTVLLAREESTFEFLDQLIKTVSSCFRSKRIHIGMDESEDMGRGKFLTKHGYVPPFEIFNEYMTRLVEITAKYGLTPMMWSDMYFKNHSKNHSYHERDTVIPEETRALIPKEVELVFWYYGETTDPECEDYMIEKHKELDRNLIFATGGWSWAGLFPENNFMMETNKHSLDACRRHGVREVMFTIWENDNSECDLFASLFGLSFFAESCYLENPSREHLKSRFEATTGGDYELFYKMCYFHNDFENSLEFEHRDRRFLGKVVFWQDVLCGIYDKALWDKPLSSHYKFAAKEFMGEHSGEWAYLYDLAFSVMKFLYEKTYIAEHLVAAYKADARDILEDIAKYRFPALKESCRELRKKHRAAWFKSYKAFCWQNMDVRYGGIEARCETASELIEAYLAGEIDEIEELCAERLPLHYHAYIGYMRSSTVLRQRNI